MLVLQNEASGFWELRATNAPEWALINDMSQVFRSGDMISALPQEADVVTIILSQARSFPALKPVNFVLTGTTPDDQQNLKLLAKLVYEAKYALSISEIFPNLDGNPDNTEAPSIRVCGTFCSECAGPISNPKLLDACLCPAHAKKS